MFTFTKEEADGIKSVIRKRYGHDPDFLETRSLVLLKNPGDPAWYMTDGVSGVPVIVPVPPDMLAKGFLICNINPVFVGISDVARRAAFTEKCLLLWTDSIASILHAFSVDLDLADSVFIVTFGYYSEITP